MVHFSSKTLQLTSTLVRCTFTILVIIFLFAGFWQLKAPCLPEDKLVVTIVQFTPISPGAEEETDNLSHRVEQKLLEKQYEGVPWKLKASQSKLVVLIRRKDASLPGLLAHLGRPVPI